MPGERKITIREMTRPSAKKIATREPNTTDDWRLACAFGEYWLGPHPLCQAETARVCGCEIADVPFPDYSSYDVNAELMQGSLFSAELKS